MQNLAFVLVEVVQLLRVITEYAACQDKAQRSGAARFEPEADECGQGGGFGRGEHGFARKQDALHLPFFQGGGNHHRLVVRAYQHGNIARLQRAAFEIQTASGGFVERVGDFVGAIVGGTAAQNVFVGFFIVVFVQPTNLYCRMFGGQPAFGTRRTDFRIADVFQNERVFFKAEQRAYAADKRGMAAVVGGERVAVLRVSGGLQVGVNVRSAKAVNRLFGIADQKQRAVLGDEDFLEDFVLQRVGVLELVDQRGFPVFGNGAGEGFGVRIVGQRGVDIEQQVVETAFAARFFHLSKAAVEIFD